MKLFRFLAQPYLFLFSYLFIVISGEHWGGFYITYILTALPAGRLQALLAVIGAIMLVVSHESIKDRSRSTGQAMNVLGVLFLIASIVYFFVRDTARYNWGTFEQTVPMLTICLAVLLGACFLVGSFWRPFGQGDIRRQPVGKA